MSESISVAAALPEAYDFDALCTPHYEALVGYAKHLLGPGRPQEAKDLVQEAFARAFRLWSSWRPRQGEDPVLSARGWMHRIVKNAFVDVARASVGHRKALDDHHMTVIENTYGVEADHHIQVLSDGIGDEVRAALAALDPDQRAIVERADFHGEQYMAIAEALGIPIGTVMSRLHRGRKRLAMALRSYAATTYGISKKEIVVRKGQRRSNRAKAAASLDVAAETPEPETDGVDRVVRGHDCGDLLGG